METHDLKCAVIGVLDELAVFPHLPTDQDRKESITMMLLILSDVPTGTQPPEIKQAIGILSNSTTNGIRNVLETLLEKLILCQ